MVPVDIAVEKESDFTPQGTYAPRMESMWTIHLEEPKLLEGMTLFFIHEKLD